MLGSRGAPRRSQSTALHGPAMLASRGDPRPGLARLMLPLLLLAACTGLSAAGEPANESLTSVDEPANEGLASVDKPANESLASVDRPANGSLADHEHKSSVDRGTLSSAWGNFWTPLTTTTTTKSPKLPPADSILGYDIPCGVRNVGTSDRIVGGVDAIRGEFPWQVSLQKRRLWDMQHICGGAIVSPYWVVTAGHCVDGLDLKDLSVVAGDHDLYKAEGVEQRRKIVRVVGLGYDKNSFANDIALLQLDRKLRFDPKHTAPICVPAPGHHYTGNAVVSGWGRLSETGGLPSVLQQVSLPLIPWNKCKQQYKSRGFLRYLHTCQVCSGTERGGQDSCQGDSGGPLACREPDGRYYLCGVVSWGIGCARAHYPGVYTEVACYARWINEVLYNEHHFLDPQNKDEDGDDD